MGRTAKDRVEGDPVSLAVYGALMEKISSLDRCELQEKASSFHVAHGRAFLGIHPRRGGLLVNIVLGKQLESSRVFRAERVSANRWHNEASLKTPRVDVELLTWIREGYAITA